MSKTLTANLLIATALVVAPAAAFADNNTCAASVTFVRADRSADKASWTLTFHVKGGNGPTGHSNGFFSYSLTHVDANNVPHPGYVRTGPSWAPADSSELDLTDDPQINPSDIRDVRVEAITSGGCV